MKSDDYVFGAALCLGLKLFLAILQFAATISGLALWLGWPWSAAAAVAILVSLFIYFNFFGSLLGAVLGVIGAWKGWGWSFLGAFLLFFWFPVLIGMLALLARIKAAANNH